MVGQKKSVLITGCSPGGIGHALALEFNARGCHVIATARNTAALGSLYECDITVLQLDVTSAENVAQTKTQVSELTKGRLDYLINNAGCNYTVPALDVNVDEVKGVFDTNVLGVMRMCQAFSPLLIEAQGCIVQIGSLAGLMPYVFGSAYNATKAALHAYSDTLRLELAPFGVRVVTIFTGGVKSNIARIDRELPENSLYQPIKTEYARRVKHSQEQGMDTTRYAASVAAQVLGTRKTSVWEGGKSWLVWFVSRYLPKWVLEIYMSRAFGLSKLKSTRPKRS